MRDRHPRRLLAAVTSLALLLGTLAVVGVAQVAAAPPAAAAAAPNPYTLTLVARECPPGSNPNVYENVRANRARNNIQETLKNLGPDTNYNDAMNPPVNPVNEAAAPQDACTPITNWPLTTGSRIDGKAPAPLDYLSKVGGSSVATYRTLASTAELDAAGNPTGRSIAGAVTITLTQQQVDLASRNSLWVMGGTRTDPLGEVANGFGPANYAFGALRCSVDALNGDNVEWVGYRNNARHAFCFALYVRPPEPNGTIVVRKAVPNGVVPPSGVDFPFQGNISYNPGGTFTLRAGTGEFNERRSIGGWYVQEQTPPDGWEFDSAACVVTPRPNQQPASTWQLTGQRVDIILAPDETVTCTFVNRPAAPPSKLVVSKVTQGGVGSFPFSVSGPGGYTGSATLTTTTPGDPVSQEFAPVAAGTYDMTETTPVETDEGRWLKPTVVCYDENGIPSVGVVTQGQTATQWQASVNIGAGQEQDCLWANTFEPKGTLVIRAKTFGGTNPAINYLTFPYDPVTGTCEFNPEQFYDQNADTTGDPAGSTWHVAQPAAQTDGIPAGTYCIAGTRPTEGADPSWVTKSIVCSGDVDYDAPYNVNTDFVTAVVGMTPRGTVTCDFTYVKRATIDVTKAITTGNTYRSGPVTVSLNCVNSAAANPGGWPLVLTVPTSATSGQLSTQVGGPIYVDGDDTGADSCSATETSQGGPLAGEAQATITPAWNGATWTGGSRTLVFNTTASLAGATSSNGNPVTVALASGRCTLSGTALQARSGAGSCGLTYTTTGNPGATTVTTAWAVSPSGASGSGTATGAFAVTAGTTPVAAFTDAYTRSAGPVTTSRTVTLSPANQTAPCRTAGKVKPNGTTVLVLCPPTTSQGSAIGWGVVCTPRGLAQKGDVVFCRAFVTKTGAVVVRTFGYRLRITVTGKAKALPTNYRAWSVTRTWYT